MTVAWMCVGGKSVGHGLLFSRCLIEQIPRAFREFIDCLAIDIPNLLFLVPNEPSFPQPLTQSTCFKVETTSTKFCCAAMTASMFL